MDTKIKILLVDDDILIHKALTNFCKKIPDAELTTAAEGESAIKLVTSNKYNIIFMDLFMPGISGYEATTEIRKLDNGKIPTIIALSGDDVSKDELEKNGFNNFAKKPMNRKLFESFVSGIKK